MRYSIKKLKQGDIITDKIKSIGGEWAVIAPNGDILSSTSKLGKRVFSIYESKAMAEQEADYLNKTNEVKLARDSVIAAARKAWPIYFRKAPKPHTARRRVYEDMLFALNSLAEAENPDD